MSSPSAHPGGEARPSGDDHGAGGTPAVSLVVGRALGTVVVTVEGELNVEGSELLDRVLGDLIEGQGNLAVAVDLGKAVVDPEAVTVFAEAATRASSRGTRFMLAKPPIETHAALQAGGYGHLVEVHPLPEAGA